jgi:hypothetical protein
VHVPARTPRAIIAKLKKSTDRGAVDTLLSLGLVDESQGRLPEAIDHLGRAHEIYSRDPAMANRDSAPDYARVLRKAGRIAEAEKIEAAGLRVRTDDDSSPTTAFSTSPAAYSPARRSTGTRRASPSPKSAKE